MVALDEYQNLNSNTSYFVASIFTCLAPHCLVMPVFTYNHERCLPTNFVLNQKMAENLATISLIVALLPVFLLIITPLNWNTVCCGKCKKQRVMNFDMNSNDSTVLRKNQPLSPQEKLSIGILYLNYAVCFFASIFFIVLLLTIHLG
mmetsp:Transcript_5521/g.9410  ORF Transcript_5521/g.9410 Transcript_5521/m.9410 type:complete len:147 (-) Transcript_5521:596-1036(-)